MISQCPICKESLFSELGFGCRMCGMPLEDYTEDFCCIDCEIKYESINKS